jgi:hypothetical protein
VFVVRLCDSRITDSNYVTASLKLKIDKGAMKNERLSSKYPLKLDEFVIFFSI